MPRRWRVALPTIGLCLFAALTYNSVRMNRETQRFDSRYFWWTSIRLDSDPLNRHPEGAEACKNGEKNCWELRSMWVDRSWLAEFLMLSALPAFLVGGFVVSGLGRLGLSQVSSFMLLMPVLICVWYYLIGWLLDRWISKRSHLSTATPD
jgi:hypothetical protein